MIYENNIPVRMDIADALRSLYPTKKWRYNEETGVTWVSTDTPQPSQEELEAEVQRLQTEFDAQEYARTREKEYPTWQDQLDDIYHNGVDGWKATIKVTKDKYPKP